MLNSHNGLIAVESELMCHWRKLLIMTSQYTKINFGSSISNELQPLFFLKFRNVFLQLRKKGITLYLYLIRGKIEMS